MRLRAPGIVLLLLAACTAPSRAAPDSPPSESNDSWHPSGARDCVVSSCACKLWANLPSSLTAAPPPLSWNSPREEAGLTHFLRDCGCETSIGTPTRHRGLQPRAEGEDFSCRGQGLTLVQFSAQLERFL